MTRFLAYGGLPGSQVKGKTMKKTFAVLMRMARIAVALQGGAIAATTLGEPSAVWLGPIVGGLMKGLRLKFPASTKVGNVLKWLPI